MLRAAEIGRVVRDGERSAVLLDGVSFAVEAGETVALLGPSGSGKSTLLRLLCALDEPTSGQLFCQGRPYTEWSPVELRRTVALMAQTPTVFDGSGWSNLWLPADLAGESHDVVRERVAEVLPLLGLTDALLAQEARSLSVGQQQRLCLARALAMGPSVVLLDEPTASLDQATADGLLDALRALATAGGHSVVLVTHQIAHARALARRVWLLVAGRLMADLPAAEFFDSSTNADVRDYLASAESGGR